MLNGQRWSRVWKTVCMLSLTRSDLLGTRTNIITLAYAGTEDMHKFFFGYSISDTKKSPPWNHGVLARSSNFRSLSSMLFSFRRLRPQSQIASLCLRRKMKITFTLFGLFWTPTNVFCDYSLRFSSFQCIYLCCVYQFNSLKL